MSDWKIVRFDPMYEEKIDPQILPLCDALNEAGLETTSSCWGHAYQWPHVGWIDAKEIRSEALARFLIKKMGGDFRPSFVMIQKEILEEGHAWSLEIHCNNVYQDTSIEDAAKEFLAAIEKVTVLVKEFGLLSK